MYLGGVSGAMHHVGGVTESVSQTARIVLAQSVYSIESSRQPDADFCEPDPCSCLLPVVVSRQTSQVLLKAVGVAFAMAAQMQKTISHGYNDRFSTQARSRRTNAGAVIENPLGIAPTSAWS